MRRFDHFSLQLHSGSILLLAASMLLIPFPWIVAWLAAATVHELGHMAAVLLCGGQITDVRLTAGGIRMESGDLTPFKSAISSAAGPAAGLLLLLFAQSFPRLAVCALLQTSCNLLPVYPLDGGRILQNCMIKLPDKMQMTIECLLLITICASIVYTAAALSLGLLPYVAVGVLVFRYLQSKNLLQRLTGRGTIVLPK